MVLFGPSMLLDRKGRTMAALFDRKTTVKVAPPTCRTIVEAGGLAKLPQYLQEEGLAGGRVFVITDANVGRHYGEAVESAFRGAGIEHAILEVPADGFAGSVWFADSLPGFCAS
jgi:hypothetical protein